MKALVANTGGRAVVPHQPSGAPVPAAGVNASSMRVRGPLLLGVFLILFFFGGFGTWAALAPLDSAAIASGTVMVGSNRKTIQHFEGGIVGEILVREGSEVQLGDPLIVLDETQPGSSLGVVRGRLRSAVALEARLLAEREKQAKIAFPDWLVKEGGTNPEVAKLIAAQTQIFASRREALESQTAILNQTVEQYNEEIQGLKGEIASETRQMELIAQEIKDVRFLLEKGLERRPRLLLLERQATDIEGSRARNTAAIARAGQAIGEAELRVLDLTTTMQGEVVEELREVQSEIHELREKERAAQDVMTRTIVRAPTTGTVVNLQVFTTGGVISPGQELMDIVPSDDALIVEARVDPTDIDVVHAGLKAQVRLTAFSSRISPIFEGRVEHVSADRLVEERTGTAYYTARIIFDDAQEEQVRDLELYPGMPAEVMIVAGERTPLSYLMQPVVSSFNRALKED